MKPDWEVLAELGVFLDLDPEEEDIAAAAFDRLGFPYPAAHYAPDLVRQLVLDLERRREAGVAVREYQEDGLGLLYYEADAADGDEDTRLQASERLVQEVAGNISASFVGPWPLRAIGFSLLGGECSYSVTHLRHGIERAGRWREHLLASVQ